jgi:hypothetical protein
MLVSTFLAAETSANTLTGTQRGTFATINQKIF